MAKHTYLGLAWQAWLTQEIRTLAWSDDPSTLLTLEIKNWWMLPDAAQPLYDFFS